MQILKEYISKLEELYNKGVSYELDKYKYLFKWSPDILSPIPYDKKLDYYKETEYLFNIRKETLDRISLKNILQTKLQNFVAMLKMLDGSYFIKNFLRAL